MCVVVGREHFSSNKGGPSKRLGTTAVGEKGVYILNWLLVDA